MNGRVSGWTYQVGAWKEKALVPTVDDLKAEEPAKVGAAAPDAGQAGAPGAGPK
jgi:hypothetical protein